MKDKFRKFYEKLGEHYPEDQIVYATLSGLLRKRWVTNKLETMPPGNLLDCGCNTGNLSKDWKKGPVFGFDIALATMIRGKKNTPATNFMQGDLRLIEFIKNNSIDNAITCEVIEHLDKPSNFLKQLYRIIKANGQILVTTPNYSRSRPELIPLGIIKSFGLEEGTNGNLYLHTAYKPDELAEMIVQAGFKIMEKGSLEFELRGWLKPLTIIRRLFCQVADHYFPTSKLYSLLSSFMDRLEIDLFGVFDTFFLSKILRAVFKEGRRSYVLAQK